MGGKHRGANSLSLNAWYSFSRIAISWDIVDRVVGRARIGTGGSRPSAECKSVSDDRAERRYRAFLLASEGTKATFHSGSAGPAAGVPLLPPRPL